MLRLGPIASAIIIFSVAHSTYGQIDANELVARHIGDLSRWRQHVIDDAAYIKGLQKVTEQTRAEAIIYYNDARSSVNGLLDQMIIDIETGYETADPQEYKTKTLAVEGAVSQFHAVIKEATSQVGRKEDAFFGCAVLGIGFASSVITIYEFVSDTLADSNREQMIDDLAYLKLPSYKEIAPLAHAGIKSASLIDREQIPSDLFDQIGSMVALSFDGEITAFPVTNDEARVNIYDRGEEPSIVQDAEIVGQEFIQISVFRWNPDCIRIETQEQVMDVCRY